MAIGDLNNIFGDAQEDEKNKKSPSNSSQSRTVTADPLENIFANAPKPTTKQVQVETAAKPKEEKSFVGKVLDKAANVAVKVASSVGNWFNENQRKNDEASLPLRELMYGKGTLVKDPVTGKNTYTTPRLEAFKAAKTPEEKAKVLEEANQDIPLIKFLNSETGKKVTGAIYENTSNIPLKVIARVKSLGDDTYDEAFAALQAKAKDPNNSRFERIMYGVQDSGIQSAIGALLSIGVSYASRNPQAGRAVSLAYFAPISAESQRRDKGQVESLTNIAIDTVGDTIISGFAESALKSVIKEGGEAGLKEFAKQMGKGFLVEGTTEPTQTVLKYANDYKNARTEAEKAEVVAKFSEYVKTGGMVDEFLIGGLSGAGITAVAVGGGKALGGTNIEVDPSLQSGGKEGGGTPPPSGGTGTGKVTAELSVNFSDVREEAGQLETAIRTDPTNDDLARRLNIVQEQLNDYQQAVKTRPVYIAEETQNAPLATIETVQYPDGKFSYRFTADTESNSVQSPFINTETYATQKQAIEAGKKEILAWVKTRLANADTVELAKLKEIQAELKKPTKPSTVKVSQETETENATIEPQNEEKTAVVKQNIQVSKGVEKTRTGVYRTTQYTQKGEAQGKAEVRFTRSKKTGKLYMEVKNKAGERIERLSLVQAKKKYGTTNRVEMVERAVNGKKDGNRWVLRQSNAPVIQNKTQNAAEKKPVKTKGEVKQSRAFKRVQERLGEFADFDVNYNRLNIAKDTANALEFIEKNPVEAKKIALGLMGAPEGITETAISIALAEQATTNKDFALAAQLERSRSLRQTRRGQEIVSERGRFNENSPHFFMQQVLAARLESAGKARFRFLSKKRGERVATGAEAKMKEGSEAIKATVKKKLSAADMAQNVINQLTC